MYARTIYDVNWFLKQHAWRSCLYKRERASNLNRIERWREKKRQQHRNSNDNKQQRWKIKHDDDKLNKMNENEWPVVKCTAHRVKHNERRANNWLYLLLNFTSFHLCQSRSVCCNDGTWNWNAFCFSTHTHTYPFVDLSLWDIVF